MVLDHEDLDLMNFVDKEKLSAPIKSTADKFQLVPEFLKVRGLVKQHLDSFNYFINVGIKKIVRENSRITSTLDPSIYLWSFKDVYVGEPSILNVGSAEVISPHMCRLADMTYAAPIYVNIEYVHGIHGKTTTTSAKDKVVIGRMPIMLRSCRCVLHGKDEEELARLGECPLDPGGYFVIEGTEKVFLIQEQLSKNRIIIDSDKKGNINASVTSSSETTKSKTVIQIEKEKIYLYLHQFVKKIPIIIVLKAMGMESDQEIVQMVGRDPRFSASLLPSMEASIECISEGVNTRQQALDYLEAKVKRSSYGPPEKDGRALYILCELLLAHVPVRDDNYRQKCFYVGVMLRRMIEAMLNKDSMDDKDYVGNKRLELSGQLISLLFEDLFKTMTTDTIKKVDAILQKLNQATRFDFSQCLTGEKNHNISFGLERTLSTGNFDIKRFRMQRKGMTQVLTRLSFIGSLGSITKISPQFEKSRKVSGPRSLQPSQWGMLCPCDTPEGESCGLVKNLALMTHVTTDQEEGPLVAMCFKLGVTDLEVSSAEELHTPDSFLVILNGLILGKHRRPHYFANSLRRLRRAGKIGKFVSVFINEKQHCVYVASDGGRVCRPLVIAENGESRVKQHHMKELKDGVRTFDDFIREGLIEYLDVNEENNALIALYESEAMKDVTHIEIEPFTILGVVAGLIPYPHHNQSPRNTYQVGYDKLGAGQNATVSVMSNTGYDIEDAIVMNKASLDRGFERCIVKKTIVATCQKYGNDTVDRILRPQRTGPDAEKMQILDDDGIAAPGEIIRPNDVYINKQIPVDTRNKITTQPSDTQYRPAREYFKGLEGETQGVERVALCSHKNGNLCIKYNIRHTRRPELGDKFSNFPFSERGICPDLIMNPHGFPSRMTVGKMMELLGSKAGVSSGRFHYGSAFGEESGHADTVENIRKTLVKHGYSYCGKELLYSGLSGEPLQTYVFMGPIYYQKLKHMVMDKMHARGSGPRVMMTRQPTEGKSKNGGLRVGEIERDCLIAYGTSMLIYERLMLSSDPFEVQVSKACGLLGYYDYKLKKAVCSTCKNGDSIANLKLPYACKLLFQELQSMNVVPRLVLREM
ncbi:unnamed protein product [Brassica napus]|uniref:DNA-directed RNA polymerase n=2 Tax=Brassica napus TaxID=3708 RepID=A0A816X5J2_BRANA|nr:unnamed protein product [Brassica napus]